MNQLKWIGSTSSTRFRWEASSLLRNILPWTFAALTLLSLNVSANDLKIASSICKDGSCAPPNFEVSCPTFEYRMWRSGNSLQRFAPNVPTFRQNVRANHANFTQDLFWCVRFPNEGIKTVEEGLASLGDRQDLNFSVPGSRCCSECWMWGGKQKDLFLHQI